MTTDVGFDDSDASPALITAAQLAQLLQVSKRTLWRLCSGKLVPEPLRIGGAVRWPLESVKKWILDGCPAPTRRENGPSKK